jgi:hypothetical protein
MKRQQILQMIGAAALVLVVIGAALYAINSPNRIATYLLLGVGGTLSIVYAAMNARTIAEFSRRRSADMAPTSP